MSKLIPRLLCAALLILALPTAAAADTLLRLATHQDAHQLAGRQQPARDGEIEVWIGDGRVSRSDGNTTVIYVAADDRLFLVDHGAETYSVVELPIDFASLVPEQMKEMTEMWKMSATVEATDDSRDIDGWKARRYEMEMTNPAGLAIRTDLWVSRDVELGDQALGLYRSLASKMLEMQPGGAEVADQLAKIEGFPVLQEATIDMGGTSLATREALESIERDVEPPAGTYEVPEGYAEQELGAGAPGRAGMPGA